MASAGPSDFLRQRPEWQRYSAMLPTVPPATEKLTAPKCSLSIEKSSSPLDANRPPTSGNKTRATMAPRMILAALRSVRVSRRTQQSAMKSDPTPTRTAVSGGSPGWRSQRKTIVASTKEIRALTKVVASTAKVFRSDDGMGTGPGILNLNQLSHPQMRTKSCPVRMIRAMTLLAYLEAVGKPATTLL